jgi:single-strand DNA-binding protein
MPNFNRVQIIGRLGKDPEKRTTRNGTAYTVFSVAVDRRWKGRDGSPKNETDWFNVEAWGKLGEICLSYLSKGGWCSWRAGCALTATNTRAKRATSPR